MAIDNNRFRILKKVLDSGCKSDKDILALTARDMLELSRSVLEMAEILELQDAVKGHRIISYLTANHKEKESDEAYQEDLY